jgi:hypothetical protein
VEMRRRDRDVGEGQASVAQVEKRRLCTVSAVGEKNRRQICRRRRRRLEGGTLARGQVERASGAGRGPVWVDNLSFYYFFLFSSGQGWDG